MERVYDIVNHPNSIVEQKFFDVIDDINIGVYEDKLIDNYKDLKTKFLKFDSFTVVMDDENDVLGFSGLQSFNFPERHSRALTRTFYTHKTRMNSLGPRQLPSLASKLMLPVHVSVAKKLDYDNVFISFEEHLGRSTFVNKFTNMLNSEYPNYNWELLQGLYNTIPHTDHKSWQHIVITKLNNNPFWLEKLNE